MCHVLDPRRSTLFRFLRAFHFLHHLNLRFLEHAQHDGSFRCEGRTRRRFHKFSPFPSPSLHPVACMCAEMRSRKVSLVHMMTHVRVGIRAKSGNLFLSVARQANLHGWTLRVNFKTFLVKSRHNLDSPPCHVRRPMTSTGIDILVSKTCDLDVQFHLVQRRLCTLHYHCTPFQKTVNGRQQTQPLLPLQ